MGRPDGQVAVGTSAGSGTGAATTIASAREASRAAPTSGRAEPLRELGDELPGAVVQ